MSYKELRIIKMSDRHHYDVEFEKRYNSPATHRSSLFINPFKNEQRVNESLELFVMITTDIVNKMDTIRKHSQFINKLINMAPAEPLKVFLARKVIIEEIMSNNEIEGVNTSRSEIIHKANTQNAQSKTKNIINQHGNMYVFLNHQELLDPFEYNSSEDIRKLYDMMVAKDVGDDDKLDGEIFRKETVSIEDGSKVVSRGLTPESSIINEINKMINYLNNDEMSSLIKIFLSHYFFEYIHPFYDGNGRTGRYLICNYLLHELDLLSAFSFSTAINRQKKGYYDAFLTVSNPMNKGEGTHFVLFLLNVMIDAQVKMIDEITRQLDLLYALKDRIDSIDELDEDEKSIVYIIAQSRVFSIKEDRINIEDLANHVNKSKQTITKICKKSVELGILIRYRLKPAVYTLDEEFFEIL